MSRAAKIDSHRTLTFGGRGMKGINFYAVANWWVPVIVTAVVCTATWWSATWVVSNELGAWGRLVLFFGLPLACAYWCGLEHGRRRS